MATKETKQVLFGKRSGLNVYPVSIGAMRLPEDTDEAVKLLRQAVDANMIYIDTSRGYGDSEIKIGKSLKNGYRQKVILSTKWSPWNIKIEETDDTSAECTYKRIIESIERLDVDYVDFYQIWSIDNDEHWSQATGKGGMLDGIFRAKDEGLVKHIGFTTHDTPENTSRYIDEADWAEAILFTYNIMNQTYKDVIAKAHDKGIATIAMNPVAGGMLTEDSPTIKKALACQDIIEIAHRYLAGDPNLDTILCGISKPSDITSTIANFQKTPLTAPQQTQVEQATRKISQEGSGFCTDCKYCLPCQSNINIPQIMRAVYLERMLQCPEFAKVIYEGYTNPQNNHANPDDCTECGQCEEKCTQKLNIIEELKYAAKTFNKK